MNARGKRREEMLDMKCLRKVLGKIECRELRIGLKEKVGGIRLFSWKEWIKVP